mmetsp:Transcript_62897/g.86448  ORF Transcript_62897/g.86448 Transcript_62897/m.86448 type:complete len:114 (-) Transcript_62897:135-476(-)
METSAPPARREVDSPSSDRDNAAMLSGSSARRTMTSETCIMQRAALRKTNPAPKLMASAPVVLNAARVGSRRIRLPGDKLNAGIVIMLQMEAMITCTRAMTPQCMERDLVVFV